MTQPIGVPMGSYAGVDWAGDKHDVLVCEEAGGELLAATFVHEEKGLRVVSVAAAVKGAAGRDRAA